MTRSVFNALTPWGWALAGLMLLIFFGLVAATLSDPFGLSRRAADRARTQAAAAALDASARRHEVQGAEETLRLAQASHRRAATAHAVADRHGLLARNAPDAETPLDPDRRRRLRAADLCLCALRPAACPADAAAAVAAGGCDHALSPADPAG